MRTARRVRGQRRQPRKSSAGFSNTIPLINSYCKTRSCNHCKIPRPLYPYPRRFSAKTHRGYRHKGFGGFCGKILRDSMSTYRDPFPRTLLEKWPLGPEPLIKFRCHRASRAGYGLRARGPPTKGEPCALALFRENRGGYRG